MENRNGLVVAAQASLAGTVAEREVALAMLDRLREEEPAAGEEDHAGRRHSVPGSSVYRGAAGAPVAPHVSEYEKGDLGKNTLTDQERADERRSISQRKRKLIERVFGWGKLDRPLRQVKLRGLKRVDWFYRLTIAAYNLVRMRRLLSIESAAS